MRFRLFAMALFIAGAAVGAPHISRPELFEAARHDISAPLGLLRPSGPAENSLEERGPRRLPISFLGEAPASDPVLQQSVSHLLQPQAGPIFDGIGLGLAGTTGALFEVEFMPPDAQGDIGPNHFVQIVNMSFAVFSRSGQVLLGPLSTNTLFAGFGGPCETSGAGDGVVLYDPLADRWLITQFAVSRPSATPFWECVAVSRTPDPTGQWARYAYTYEYFNDYPKLGVWPDGYYVTYNLFTDERSDQFRGVLFCAFDRTRMLAGEPAAQQCATINDSSSGVTPADFDGTLLPPAGEPNVAVSYASSALRLYSYHVDWTAPGNSSVDSVEVKVAPFAIPCSNSISGGCVPQPARAPPLDALSDRMMYRAAYRNFGDHEALVANHTVVAGSSAGVRWYELRDPAGSPSVYQQGTYAPDSGWRWMGSAALDRAGNIGLGFSLSGEQTQPSIGYTGRTPSDPLGVMGQGEALAAAGQGTQTGSVRWGDYTNLSVDPVDECTFWYANQYLVGQGPFNWRTRIFTFLLPGCADAPAYSIWPSPALQPVGRGRAVAMQVATAALVPAAAQRTLLLTVSGLPSGLRGTLEPASIQAGQSTTLSLVAASNLAPGQYSFTLRAADDGGFSVSATGQAFVLDSDFSISRATPAAVVSAGATAEVRIDTQLLFGNAEKLDFSTSAAREGVVAAFAPSTIRTGESTQLALLGSQGLTPSVSDIRVIATSAVSGISHAVTVRVRALRAPNARITWPPQYSPMSGTETVKASAFTSDSTKLSSMELLVDGIKAESIVADGSPAVFSWDSHSVSDGTHLLMVRATDTQGGIGDSPAVRVTVDNKGPFGCSSTGGPQIPWLLGLLAAARRRRGTVLKMFRS
jgi:hypothetical protein